MLEKAGGAPKAIRMHNHNLRALVKALSGCEIEVVLAPGLVTFASAARLCSIDILCKNICTPLGRLLDAESEGASVYPNEVRYGASFRHFPAEVLVGMATAVADFATEHWNSIRVKGIYAPL
jgi:hypothetical protein